MKKKTINKIIFGKRLAELMAARNETTYSMADEFSLTSPTISRYMTGQMAAKITTIEQMANYFNVNPVWLMGYDVPKERDFPSYGKAIESIVENRTPDILRYNDILNDLEKLNDDGLAKVSAYIKDILDSLKYLL